MSTPVAFLGILIFISIVVCGGTSDPSLQLRYRRLVQRYMSNVKARSSMVSRPGATWLCRRGKTIALCGHGHAYQRRRGSVLYRRSLKKSRPLTIANAIGRVYKCSNSTCKHGHCVSGRCVCTKGWIGQRCGIDVNECARGTHSCNHHKCINRPGSYKCSCRYGYRPRYDGKYCLSKRTKSARPGGLRARSSPQVQQRSVHFPSKRYYRNITSPYYYRSQPRRRHHAGKATICKTGCRYKCIYRGGVEKCICPKGFSLSGNGISCIDINECLDIANSECPANQKCVNTRGSYTCVCKTGYVMAHTLYGKHCKDANECLNGDNVCGITAKCVNNVGSYSCECENGQLKASNNRDCVSEENAISGLVINPSLEKLPPTDDIQ